MTTTAHELASLLDRYTGVYLQQLRALDSLEDPGVIHDFRVATRRLTELSRLLERLDPHDKAIACLVETLVPAARSLSRLRERDVCLELLAEVERSLPPHEYLVRWGVAAFRPRLQDLRERSARKARLRLNACRVEALEKAVARLRAASFDVSNDTFVLERDALIACNEERVVALFPALSLPVPPVRPLHELRIAFKALRYAVELSPPGPEVRKRLKRLKQFQNGLGGHRDWLELRNMVRAFRGKSVDKGRSRDLLAGLEALTLEASRRAEAALALTRTLVPFPGRDSL